VIFLTGNDIVHNSILRDSKMAMVLFNTLPFLYFIITCLA